MTACASTSSTVRFECRPTDHRAHFKPNAIPWASKLLEWPAYRRLEETTTEKADLATGTRNSLHLRGRTGSSSGLVVRAAIAVEPDEPLGAFGHLSYSAHELGGQMCHGYTKAVVN